MKYGMKWNTLSIALFYWQKKIIYLKYVMIIIYDEYAHSSHIFMHNNDDHLKNEINNKKTFNCLSIWLTYTKLQ